MKRLYYIGFTIIILLMAQAVVASIQNANYLIESTTFASAGGSSSSTGYSMSLTLGQGTAIGESSSFSYEQLAGFWYQLQKIIVKGDLDGDADVDLHDVIIGLKILTGNAVDGITPDGDVNNDSKVGIEEVLFDLNKASQ